MGEQEEQPKDGKIAYPVLDRHNIPRLRGPVTQPNPAGPEPLDVYITEIEMRSDYGRAYCCIYGVAPDGNSVVARVHDFRHHFSVLGPEDTSDAGWGEAGSERRAECHERFRVALDAALRRRLASSQNRDYAKGLEGAYVTALQPYAGHQLYGYNGEAPQEFVRIEVAHPKFVRECLPLLEYPRGQHGDSRLPTVDPWWPVDLPTLVAKPNAGGAMNRGFPEIVRVFEANIDYTMRFEVDHGIRPSGWARIAAGAFAVLAPGAPKRVSSADIEVTCAHGAVGPSTRPATQVPPMTVLSYDEECEIGPDGEFPDAEHQRLTQIGVKKVFGATVARRAIHCVGSCTRVEDVDEVYCYPNEAAMLCGFATDVRVTDPDVITGYNIRNFDNAYLLDRMKATATWHSHGALGRILADRVRIFKSSFSSSAHKTETKTMTVSGRIQIDMIETMKREKKLRSYKLESVCQEFLGDGKISLDYHDINTHNATPEGRALLSKYCVRDAELPHQLMVKLKSLVNYVQMANVAGVTVQQLLDRGQQMRILAQVCHHARALPVPYVIPVNPSYRVFPHGKYQGATVLTATVGLHPLPVSTMDFASLYPSIMIAGNTCWSTFVTAEQAARWSLVEGVHYRHVPEFTERPDGSVAQVRNTRNARFLLPPDEAAGVLIAELGLDGAAEGVDYVTVRTEAAADGAAAATSARSLLATPAVLAKLAGRGLLEGTHFGVDAATGRVVLHACKKGVLPTLLEHLLQRRAFVRKVEMARCKGDDVMTAILDALQLAYKVMANSMYGATGTGAHGYLPLREVAESVTRYGRGYIMTTSHHITSHFNKAHGYPFNTRIIYGGILYWSCVCYGGEGDICVDGFFDA